MTNIERPVSRLYDGAERAEQGTLLQTCVAEKQQQQLSNLLFFLIKNFKKKLSVA